MSEWTFLTNHANVLLCVAREPDTRLRHIADCVGITERATHRIICDLIEAGYLTKHRLGRRSYYEVHVDAPLRDPLDSNHQVGDLFQALLRNGRTRTEQLTPSST
ncbi:MAG TPA: ArsR family transcriptional regulator [Acidimicrobiales bacterium]|nr:ArsR family transcriptional regulator [Acidimicrobiales bacterium]